ncbi:MAG: dTDP-4-dehydrorhamnose reductase family protein [Bacteroidota bacterium]
MSRVFVLGSTGMLGHQVVLRLNQRPDIQVFDLSFRNKFREETVICDVTDFHRLEQLIAEIQPDIIINCIGVLIKGSNDNPKNSILINAYLPHYLVSLADRIGAKVIHVSTDCVFSGKKGGYVESDFRDADDVYGRGKALGEIFSDKHLTLRTSIIGPELKMNGEGLFHWFMNQNGRIDGYSKSIWGGVTTLELAKVIDYILKKEIFGLIHITNSAPISKFELLSLIKKIWNKNDVYINKTDGKVVDKSLLTIRDDFNYEYKGYSEMLMDLKLFMASNKDKYNYN